MRIVADTLGEPADEVVLAPAHTVPKTSSGKLRRAACREIYESGRIGARERAVWWQVVRLAAGGAVAQVAALSGKLGPGLYALYAGAIFFALAPAVWLATAVLVRPAWAWSLGHLASRLFLRLLGMPLVVRGLDRLPPGRPHVIVANHASYLDGIVLAAALPSPVRFVAKQELAQALIPRVYLRRLGAEFVERFDSERSAADASRLAAIATAPTPLAFFAEGTFRRSPGLLPFRLGAFVAAASAGVPVVPVALRGTREALPDGAWAARRVPITVTIGEPLAVPGTPDVFASAVELRDRARAAIAAQTGEP